MKTKAFIVLLLLTFAVRSPAQPIIHTAASQAELADSTKGLTVALVGTPGADLLMGGIIVEPAFGSPEVVVLCVYNEDRKLLVRSVLGIQELEPKLTTYEFSVDRGIIKDAEALVSKRIGDELIVWKIKLAGFIKNEK